MVTSLIFLFFFGTSLILISTQKENEKYSK